MPMYFDFEVSLLGVEPRVWRRFLLANDATFLDLHYAVQVACGWEQEHLYEFRSLPGTADSPPGNWMSESDVVAVAAHGDGVDADGNGVPVDQELRLTDYFPAKGEGCLYLYDFSDEWLHGVELKQIVDVPEAFRARLLGGERAFPHEDSGGIDGYAICCEAATISDAELLKRRVADPEEADELEERREWLGDWDPDVFDLEAVKAEFDE